jgi:hypothetical protein
MSTNWSDRDFEELLRRASELERNKKDHRSSVSELRAAFNASQMKRETAQPAKILSFVRVALWSIVVLLGIAAVWFLVTLLEKS